MSTTIQLYAFVWGAVWGSFLNVVVYRLPRALSLACPRPLLPWAPPLPGLVRYRLL